MTEVRYCTTGDGVRIAKRFQFLDRGEFLPKGFDDPVRLCEVRCREED